MYLNALNAEDCNQMYYLNGNKSKVFLIII